MTTALLAFLLTGLVRICAFPAQDAPAGHDAAESRSAWAGASIDALIEALPDVRQERRFDRATRGFVLHPAAAEMRLRLDRGAVLTDSQWRRALRVSGAFRARGRWPKEEPFAVSLRAPSWLGVAQIRLTPRLSGLAPAAAGFLETPACGTSSLRSRQAGKYQRLGLLPAGTTAVEFDVLVERGMDTRKRRGAEAPPPGVLWSGSLAFPVELVDGVDAALPPASDPELDAAVRASVSLAFRNYWKDKNTRELSAVIVVDVDTEKLPSLDATALSLRVEVLHGGRVVESVNVAAHADDPSAKALTRASGENRAFGFAFVKSIPAALETGEAASAGYELRVTGTHDGVLASWDAERWWNGSLTMALAEAIASDRASDGAASERRASKTPAARRP
jgi:hypothetical protein